jgi:hypothetical protein
VIERTPDDERTPPDEDYVREEEELAAAEARRIGGRGSDEEYPPEERPVREAGGGEAEGFEDAEEELIENAEHGDGAGNPLVDEFTPEEESDLSTADYGEADEEEPPDR